MKSAAVALTVAAKIGPPAPSGSGAHPIFQDRRLQRRSAGTKLIGTGGPTATFFQRRQVAKSLPSQHIVVNRKWLLDIFVLGVLERLV